MRKIIEISEEEYDKLNSLAKANQAEIDKRALELWEKKGPAWLKLSTEIRCDDGRGLLESEHYIINNDGYVYSGEVGFDLSNEEKDKMLKKFEGLFNRTWKAKFGTKLLQINEIYKLKVKIQRTWYYLLGITILGWLVAATFLILHIFF